MTRAAERSRSDLRAEHRAVVIGEDEDDGPSPKVVAESDGPPRLVPEGEVEREGRGQVLFDAHLPQVGVDRLPVWTPSAREPRRQGEREEERSASCRGSPPEEGPAVGAAAANPLRAVQNPPRSSRHARSAIRSITRSIGMRATPAAGPQD